MINTLLYLRAGFDETLLIHNTSKHELIPCVGDYIEFDDYADYPEEYRNIHGSTFKVQNRRIGYSVHKGYTTQLFIRLYLIPVSEIEYEEDTQ